MIRSGRPTVWLNVITGIRFREHEPRPGTRMARKGYVRLIEIADWRHDLYIKEEELRAPVWMRTATK